jgi:hypothetical protein
LSIESAVIGPFGRERLRSRLGQRLSQSPQSLPPEPKNEVAWRGFRVRQSIALEALW